MPKNYQSDAAKRGLKVELVLIERINSKDPECQWIVEECCESTGYGNFKATKPDNREKPDLIIHSEKTDDAAAQGISLKSYKKGVSFCQANRGKLETFIHDLDIPVDVSETLRLFTIKDPKGKRVMLNKAPQDKQKALLSFFTKSQKVIIAHVLQGKFHASLKANWMLFHETMVGTWDKNVGNKNFWRLYPMEMIIDTCCSSQPTFSKKGNLILGIGLTLQRKGGDNGKETANDLQFKINPIQIIKVIAKI